jgi:hypothetical protein
MISIIISSSNPEYLSAVKKNIDETVGIPYEIIAVPNGDGKKGICEVYNAAGAKAKYDVLCFMHEDVILHTQAWGRKVAEILSDPEIGLLGVAGSTYKTLTPGGWAPPALPPSRYKTNFLQHFKFAEKERIHDYYNSDNESTSQVVTVDGVWMCTRKEIFEQFKFDEQMLKRFHGYDIDYSLQVGSAYKVMVTFEVLLEHFSEGNYSDEWLDAMFLVHEKHKQILPINIGNLPVKEARYSEKVACKILLKYAADQHYSASDKIKLLWKYDLYRAFGWNRFLLFNLHVLSKRY